MNEKGQIGMSLFIVGAIMFAIFIWCVWAFSIVQYNEYAYEVEFGKLDANSHTPGFTYVGFGSLVRVNNQVRGYNIHVEAATNDMQEVNFDVNINAKLKKDEAYNFIKDYKSEDTFFTYVNNKIQEKAKTIIYKYNAKDMLDKRLVISAEIKNEVSKMPELKYFELEDLALANIKYSDEYNKIIEDKAKLDVQREIIIKQKENLALQQQNINGIDVDKYFKYQLIEKWDGKAPLFLGQGVIN